MSATWNKCLKLSSAQILLAANHGWQTIQYFYQNDFYQLIMAWKAIHKKVHHEYCSSLQKRNAKNERAIDRRTWKNCLLYQSTIAAMKKHKGVCLSKQQKDSLAEDLISEEINVKDDLWITDAKLTVADGQANIF